MTRLVGGSRLDPAATALIRSDGPSGTPSVATRTEGRLFGGIVLAAFVLYGIGSASADETIGMTLVVLNSTAVAVAGLIGWRLLRGSEPRIGLGYLAGRIAEGVLLAGGIIVAELGDVGGADTKGYLLGMVALAVGSVPFCRALGRGRWIPRSLATWGVYGYAALAGGALLELATGRPVAVVFAVPGGLFELALGVVLLRHGFGGCGSAIRRHSSSEIATATSAAETA